MAGCMFTGNLRDIAFAGQALPITYVDDHGTSVSHLRNSLFDRVLCDEAVDHDFVRLTDPVRATERLDVVVGVPVAVVDEDGVGSGQVDPEAASPGREQKGEVIGAGCCVRKSCQATR